MGREEGGELTQQTLFRDTSLGPGERQVWAIHSLVPPHLSPCYTVPCRSLEWTVQHGMDRQSPRPAHLFRDDQDCLSWRVSCSSSSLTQSSPSRGHWTQLLLSPPVSVVYDLIRGNIFPLHTSVAHLLAQALELCLSLPMTPEAENLLVFHGSYLEKRTECQVLRNTGG